MTLRITGLLDIGESSFGEENALPHVQSPPRVSAAADALPDVAIIDQLAAGVTAVADALPEVAIIDQLAAQGRLKGTWSMRARQSPGW